MVQFQVYPRSKRACPAMLEVVGAFRAHESAVDSAAKSESSNAVLAIVAGTVILTPNAEAACRIKTR